jgi:rhodanese-related sulfurtransferase
MKGGMTVEKKTIIAKDVVEKIQNGESVFVLDVRDEEKFQAGSLHVKGVQTINIPYVAMRDEEENVKDQMAHLPKGTEIITVCTTGNKAGKAAALLREKGYSALSLEGGLTAWKEHTGAVTSE